MLPIMREPKQKIRGIRLNSKEQGDQSFLRPHTVSFSIQFETQTGKSNENITSSNIIFCAFNLVYWLAKEPII